MRPIRVGALTAFACVASAAASGMERFPPPDFDSGYELPETTTPSRSTRSHEVDDAVVLFFALASASFLALKVRSRRWLYVVMLFSLAYFGFYRKGCVCSVGAIQNVTLALFDRGYAVPLAVLAFFVLPLVFTLLFGRTFCAAVCPLGAMQDVVLLRPAKVPRWLAHALELLPYVYLGLAVLLAATGSAFLICRYDPFVSFFRLSGSASMLVFGACFLTVSLFIGRPYCRFLCPYGAILRQLSSASKWHLTIAPDECVRCRLCEDSCPVGAVLKPTGEQAAFDRAKGKQRLAILLALLPVLVAVGAILGGWLGGPLSRMNATVALAERVRLEESGRAERVTDASEAFRKTGRPSKELFEEALKKRAEFALGGRLFGAFLGLAVGLKMLLLSIRRTRTGYEPDRAKCVSCGRCFGYCPQERAERKKPEAAIAAEEAQ